MISTRLSNLSLTLSNLCNPPSPKKKLEIFTISYLKNSWLDIIKNNPVNITKPITACNNKIALFLSPLLYPIKPVNNNTRIKNIVGTTLIANLIISSVVIKSPPFFFYFVETIISSKYS